MVGREDELGLLRLVLGRAQKLAKPGLVTLVGPPGIGKSRLAREFLRDIDAAGMERVTVVRGRCLAYDGGPYRRRIRYGQEELVPPLDPREAEWVEGVLAKVDKRAEKSPG